MVSIVIPVYNAQNYIVETMDSVLAQTFTEWELLLVDDCSPDNSAEVIENYIASHPERKIRLITQETNQGAAKARNRGVEEAQGRYIAYLDADDLWFPEKLEKELQFMNKHNAGFVYCAYEFGDEQAVPTGKRVRVPLELDYKHALTRTIIFTSTVLIDTEKVGKPFMPDVPSEDSATWWNILKQGNKAYGLDEPLAIYRRPAESLSSNKVTAVKRIWNLYRNVEGLGIPAASLCFCGWALHATVRRILDDTIRAHFEALKRFTVLQLSLMGLVIQTALYAYFWFNSLYPVLHAVRYYQNGKSLGIGISLYFRGHLLILFLYLAILIALSQASGAMKIGYRKPGTVVSAEITALTITDIFTYFQLSLMKNWLLPVNQFILLLAVQIITAFVWIYFADWIFRKVFPPRETLVVDLGGNEEKLEQVITAFCSREDRYRVEKVIHGATLEQIKKEVMCWYGCVVIVGGDGLVRRDLVEYCYKHLIRIYLVPETGDLLLQGTEWMDLFDKPLLELKEYTIRWESRLVKRLADILIAFPIVLVSMLVYPVRKAFGYHVEKTVCLGKQTKEFVKYGKGFRNVLNGTMSLVGPEPFEKEQANRYMEEDERFDYRYRIKPGITCYAQLSGCENIADQLKMDLYYMLHYSLGTDFRILLRSITSRKEKSKK